MAFRLAGWLILLICSTAVLTAQATPPALGDPLRFKRVARVTAVAVDPQGNQFIAGTTSDPAFYTTSGALNRSCGSDGRCGATFNQRPRGLPVASPHGFLIKLAPDGNLIATFLGGDGELLPLFIEPVSDGIYVAGEFREAVLTAPLQFPLKRAVVTGCGQSDAFVMKLNPSASDAIFSTCIQGPFRQAPIVVRGFGVDGIGAAVIGGNVDNRNFPLVNALQPVYTGSPGFITKLSSMGELQFSTIFGGSRNDSIWSLAVENNGDIHLTGNAQSPDFPITRPIQSSLSGPTDAFVAKLHRDGQMLLYSTYLGGAVQDVSWDIAVDRNGDAWVVGDTHSVDFPTTADALRTASACGRDAACALRNPAGFLAEFDSDGRLRYSTLITPDRVEPGQPGGVRIEAILIGPRNEKQLIGVAAGDMPLVRPLTSRPCTGLVACGLLMTIGPRNDIQFSSRFAVGDRLTDFPGSAAALGPNGELFIVTPTPDFRGSQIYTIGVNHLSAATLRF
jgi:hypothetical protein